MVLAGLRQLGALRWGLLLLGLLLVLLRPAVDAPVEMEGWGLVRSMIVPALSPLILMLLLLDALMSRVGMAAAEQPADYARFRLSLWLNLAMAALVLLVWVPWFLVVLGG